MSENVLAARLVTHHSSLDDSEQAYDVFERAAVSPAIKIVLTPEPHSG